MEVSKISTVEEITQWIHDEIDSWLSNFDSINREMFEYVGVNLDLLVKVMTSKASSKEEFMKDMSTLIVIVQVRGVNLKKILARISDDGKNRLNEIVLRYGINAHKRDLKSETPSLPRIMSLFPELICAVRKKYSKLINKPLGKVPTGLEEELCFPGGCALIKTSDTSKTDKWVEWYSSFCEAVKMNPMPTREQMLIAQKLSKVNL